MEIIFEIVALFQFILDDCIQLIINILSDLIQIFMGIANQISNVMNNAFDYIVIIIDSSNGGVEATKDEIEKLKDSINEFDYIVRLFDWVSKAIDNFRNHAKTLLYNLFPFIRFGLAISFMLLGYAAISGKFEIPILELLKQIFKWTVLTGIAFNVTYYQEFIGDAIINIPDDLAKKVTGIDSDSVLNTLDDILNKSMALGAINDWVGGGVAGAAKVQQFGNVMNQLLVSGFVVVAVSNLLVAKVLLHLLMAVGPIYIILAGFPSLKQYFSSWLRQIIAYTLVIFITCIILNIFGNLLSELMLRFTIAISTGGEVASISTGLISMFSLLLMGLLSRVNQIAQGLTGAFTTELGSALNKSGGMPSSTTQQQAQAAAIK